MPFKCMWYFLPEWKVSHWNESHKIGLGKQSARNIFKWINSVFQITIFSISTQISSRMKVAYQQTNVVNVWVLPTWRRWNGRFWHLASHKCGKIFIVKPASVRYTYFIVHFNERHIGFLRAGEPIWFFFLFTEVTNSCSRSKRSKAPFPHPNSSNLGWASDKAAFNFAIFHFQLFFLLFPSEVKRVHDYTLGTVFDIVIDS